MQRLLTQEQDEVLQRERSMLEELRLLLARVHAAEADLTLLKTSNNQMQELFMLVVVGEFNAGKTAFLNAMLGERLLTEGVTPTTSHVHILRYGEQFQQEVTPDDILLLHLPVEWLRDINLVVIVEGAGGFLVPLNHRQSMADLAAALDIPIILVVGMKLGCINHALLTAEAIKTRQLYLHGWIANQIEPGMAVYDENITAITQKLGANCMANYPYSL